MRVLGLMGLIDEGACDFKVIVHRADPIKRESAVSRTLFTVAQTNGGGADGRRWVGETVFVAVDRHRLAADADAVLG